MFGIITKHFIENFKYYFYQLKYKVENNPNHKDFVNCTMKELSHCTYNSMFDVLICYNYCSRKWKKIEKAYETKREYCNQIKISGRRAIQVLKDEVYKNSDSLALLCGTYLDCKNEYIIKVTSPEIKKLLNSAQNQAYFHLVEYDDFEYLEKDDEFIGVYEKEYISSLGKKTQPNKKMLVAKIQNLAIDKRFNNSFARITYLKELPENKKVLIKSIALFEMIKTKDSIRKSNTLRFNSLLRTGIMMSIISRNTR